jgi:hypothetical protein
MSENADITRQVRKVLKRAYPSIKFAVSTNYDVRIDWTDDGPTQDEVENALVKDHCAEPDPRYSGNHLRIDGRSVAFYRYNAAASEACKRDFEESRRRQVRVNEVVRGAERIRWENRPRVTFTSTPTAVDQIVIDAFETLRQRAEKVVDSEAERDRRPSWAPPLIIDGELHALCLTLGYLTLDEKPIARLWAMFADLKHVGTYFRQNLSRHTFPGVLCRGFQLFAGATREGRSELLFEAQKDNNDWQFGPSLYPREYSSPRYGEWYRLVQDRARYQETPGLAASVASLDKRIATIEAEDQVAAKAFNERQLLRFRAVELAKARVLDFVGAPDAQMQLAGHLWGHCYICGKELTDAISLERGVGPDCYQHEIDVVRGTINLLRESGGEVTATRVACITMRPTAFVEAVLQQKSA